MNHGGSHTSLPIWIKNKNSTISPINTHDNKCFEYAKPFVLNHK